MLELIDELIILVTH